MSVSVSVLEVASEVEVVSGVMVLVIRPQFILCRTLYTGES
jgi:hypothetical protein